MRRAPDGGVGPWLMTGVLMCALHACGPNADAYPFERPEGCETPCETDAGMDAGPPVDAGPPPYPDEPLEDWDTDGAGPLSGVFAVEVQLPVRAVVEVESRQLYRLRILQRGSDARLAITPCRFALPNIPGVVTLGIPERLEEVLRGLRIDEQGAFLSAEDPLGATLVTPRVHILLGADLSDPVSDPLPTAAAPESALDQDEDGELGVTLSAETVLCRQPEVLYAAVRASVSMQATIEDLDAFEGDVSPTLEQSVLGFSDDCLAAAAGLEIEVLEGSRLRAVRVGEAEDLDANGNVSCPEIAWRAAPLFGDYWSGL